MELTPTSLWDLSGTTSAVTGAGRGMGQCMAEALASHGSAVVLVDMNGEAARSAAELIVAKGGKASALELDITDADAPDRIIAAAKDLGGSIDVLINNAGILSNSKFPEFADEDWDRVMNINLRAPMRIMRSVLAQMIQQGSGNIINIGSSWSSRGAAFNQSGGGPDYCASKAAIQALTRSAAQDVAPYGIRVNAIAPGAVDTPMHEHHREFLFEYEKYIPVGRMQIAEDVAGTAVYLASKASAYVTGQTIHVNGGLLMID